MGARRLVEDTRLWQQLPALADDEVRLMNDEPEYEWGTDEDGEPCDCESCRNDYVDDGDY